MPVIPATWKAKAGESPEPRWWSTRHGSSHLYYNPSTLVGQGGQITRSGVQDQPGRHGETSFLLKIQKLAGHGGGHLQSQLHRRLRQKNRLNSGGEGCSKPRPCHCIPAWQQSETLSQKKKKKWLGMVVCAYKPSYLGAWGMRIFEKLHLKNTYKNKDKINK